MKRKKVKSKKNKIVKFNNNFGVDMVSAIQRIGKKHKLDFNDSMSNAFALMITLTDESFCEHETDRMIEFIRNNIK